MRFTGPRRIPCDCPDAVRSPAHTGGTNRRHGGEFRVLRDAGGLKCSADVSARAIEAVCLLMSDPLDLETLMQVTS
jgi:hypothetical protein